MILFIVKSTCVCAWYMHVGPHVAGICIAHVWRSEESSPAMPALFPNRVSHWTCCLCAPTPLLACSDESPEILLFLLLVLVPKPFLLPGIGVWEATLRFYMEPRIPNLYSKHSYLLCCFPSPRVPFNYQKKKKKLNWWGTSVIQTLGNRGGRIFTNLRPAWST